MSREIKFRAWTRQNPPIAWSPKAVAITGTGEQIVPIGGTFTGIWHATGDPGVGDLIIEQFTGLLDRNGKEIYVGDIVQIAGERASIVFDKELASYMGRFPVEAHGQIIEANDYIHAFCPHDIKVIGNIHENPGLLEKQVDGESV